MRRFVSSATRRPCTGKPANITHTLEQLARAKLPGALLYWTLTMSCGSEAVTLTVLHCKNLY